MKKFKDWILAREAVNPPKSGQNQSQDQNDPQVNTVINQALANSKGDLKVAQSNVENAVKLMSKDTKKKPEQILQALKVANKVKDLNKPKPGTMPNPQQQANK